MYVSELGNAPIACEDMVRFKSKVFWNFVAQLLDDRGEVVTCHSCLVCRYREPAGGALILNLSQPPTSGGRSGPAPGILILLAACAAAFAVPTPANEDGLNP